MCVANVTQPCAYGACIVKGVAFACPLWCVLFMVGPNPTWTNGCFKSGVRRFDVEEVLTAILPKQSVSSDEELDLFSNPLLASPPGKEVEKKRCSHLIWRWTSLRLLLRPLCHKRR